MAAKTPPVRAVVAYPAAPEEPAGKRHRNFATPAAEPWRSSGVAHPAAEATMGFGLIEIAIVMSCISILGYIIADNLV